MVVLGDFGSFIICVTRLCAWFVCFIVIVCVFGLVCLVGFDG